MGSILLGQITRLQGMVGPMIWSGARPPASIERSLGFQRGRLGQGYYILLLKERVRPEDIVMEGTTLRSGGRMGLPAATSQADDLRPRVRKTIDPYTRDFWRDKLGGINTPLRGMERWCKIRPVVPHSTFLAPSDQYPPGGGGGQWTLKHDYNFLIAAFVDDKAVAHAPGGLTVSVAEDAFYDDRARLTRYLEAA